VQGILRRGRVNRVRAWPAHAGALWRTSAKFYDRTAPRAGAALLSVKGSI